MADDAKNEAGSEAKPEVSHDSSEAKTFPKGFKYDTSTPELCRDLYPYEMAPQYKDFHSSFGFPALKRYNLHYIDYGVLLYACGNTVQTLDLFTNKKNVILNTSQRPGFSVGGVAVHPSLHHFAVAERGVDPKIYIYEYPSLDIVRILRNGTEMAYSDVEFSGTGNKLASVGDAPDYTLTVWDWDKERVILKTKAFAQEVFRVTFSPRSEGTLVTSGQGHIRFWKMATTFTGLKLQGDIGKFGNVELSDISAYCELPDGRTLSGSENGYLLMWDGNFIQFQIGLSGGRTCHEGAIEFIHLENMEIITAGADGMVKRFSFKDMEFAETTDEEPILILEPLMEVKVGDGVSIVNMLRGDDHWIVQDANGSLFKLWVPNYDVEIIFNVHAGPLSGVVTAPHRHNAITAGTDGSVRCWDLDKNACVMKREFDVSATAMISPPKAIDSEGRTVIVAFADGAVRILRRFAQSFQMIAAFKPHTSAVCCLAMSPDGKILATGSTDSSLFFFTVDGDMYTPLGLVDLEDPPKSMSFSSDSSKLLLASGRNVVEVTVPDAALYGKERETFKIDIQMRKYQPHVPIVRVVEIDDPEDEDELEKIPYDAPTEEVVEIECVDNVSALVYSSKPNHVFLTFDSNTFDDNEDRGDRYEYIYECDLGEETPVRKLHMGAGCGTCTFMGYSLSAQYMLLGHANGVAQIRHVNELQFFMMFTVHDSKPVSAVQLTHDDKLLVTTGSDGQLFSHVVEPGRALKTIDRKFAVDMTRIFEIRAKEALPPPRKRNRKVLPEDEKSEEQKEWEAEKIKKETEEKQRDYIDPKKEVELRARLRPNVSTEKVAIKPAKSGDETLLQQGDSHDAAEILATAYSIEEQKLKQEEDDRMSAAERKKAGIRLEIEQLRKEFQFLLKKNLALDPRQRLERDAFELDPKLRLELEKEAQEQISLVQKELAWISEKHAIALQKLRGKFLDTLIVEHITLRSFRMENEVSCYRTPELPPFLRDAIQQVHELINSEKEVRREKESSTASTISGLEETDNLASDRSDTRDPKASTGRMAHKKGKGKGGRSTGVSEAELRKKARAERKKQLEKLKASKPDKNVDDPMDVAAVQYAERNMGDYKLKSDPNYVVPENQRVNAERKKRQMVLLQESVHFIKSGFNERFLAMRDLKSRIIKNVQEDNKRLRELNAKLGHGEDTLFQPKVDKREWPELREEVEEGESKKAEETKEEKSAGETSKSTAVPASTSASVGASSSTGASNTISKSTEATDSKTADAGDELANQHAERLALVPKSDLEKAEDMVNLQLLQHERKTLLEKIDFAVWTFDQALAKLRREKFKLDTDLKTTDLKILTLYQELNLLKDFEETENALFAKMKTAKSNKLEVVAAKTDCEKQLNHKLAEIKTWQEKDKQVMAEFNQVVGGEKSEFYPQLLKIFKKKVKRKKKKAVKDVDLDDEDSDPDNDGYDSDDDSDDDDSDSEEEEDDSCPPHCDLAIYEKVLELLEKRLEQEEVLAEFNKAVSELNKTYERYQLKEKQIDKELTATENDIETFQSEKQRALNRIEVTVPLKLSQMKYLIDDKLPADISNALIFTSTGLEKLSNRIHELGQEKIQLSKQFKDLKRGHKVLLKELQTKRAAIAVEQKKCEDVQMLKFGQIIDLSILAKVGVDEGAAELKRKLKLMENSSVVKLTEWDKKIQDAKDELAKITQQNTRWLERVAKLTKAQYDLEDQLNTTTKNVHVADNSGGDVGADNDRRQLLQLVHIQEKEIDALKAEIHVLRRKGGHVYTPAN